MINAYIIGSMELLGSPLFVAMFLALVLLLNIMPSTSPTSGQMVQHFICCIGVDLSISCTGLKVELCWDSWESPRKINSNRLRAGLFRVKSIYP